MHFKTLHNYSYILKQQEFSIYILGLLFLANVISFSEIQAQEKESMFSLESPYTNGFQKIQSDSEGNLYASGYFQEMLRWEGKELWIDNGGYFLAKMDSNYHLKWVIQLTAPVRDLQIVKDRLFVLGHFKGKLLFAKDTLQSKGGFDSYLCEVSPKTGEIIWKKQFSATSDILAQSLTSEGNSLYILGHFEAEFVSDEVKFTPYYFKNAYLIRFNLEGKTQWGKRLSGGHNSLTGVYGRKVEADSLGNVFVGGGMSGYADFEGETLRSSSEHFYGEGLVYNHDIFLARYRADSGDLVWVKRLAQYADLQDIKADGNGSVYLAGYFQGCTSNPQNYGNAWFGNTQLQAQKMPSGEPSEDSFLAKISPLGNYIWLKHAQAETHNRGIALAVDAHQDLVFLTGVFEGSLSINKTEWTIQSPENHRQDLYWVCFRANGAWVEGDFYGGSASEQVHTLVLRQNGELILSGRFSSEVTQGTQALARNNAFVLKIKNRVKNP